MDATIRSQLFEPLEPRVLLTCVVEQVGDTLGILGHEAAQVVNIVDHGHGDISVNCAEEGGESYGFRFQGVRLIEVATHGGDDRISYQTNGTIERAADLRIDAGAGRDVVELSAQFINAHHEWAVRLGGGADVFTALARGDGASGLQLMLDTGAGADMAEVDLGNFAHLATMVKARSTGESNPDCLIFDILGGDGYDARFDLHGDIDLQISTADVGLLHVVVEHDTRDALGRTGGEGLATRLIYTATPDTDGDARDAMSLLALRSMDGEVSVNVQGIHVASQFDLTAEVNPAQVSVPDGGTILLGGLISAGAKWDNGILVVSAADGPMPQTNFDARLAIGEEGLMLEMDAQALQTFSAALRGSRLESGYIRATAPDMYPATLEVAMDRVIVTGNFQVALTGGDESDQLTTRFANVNILPDAALNVLLDGRNGADTLLAAFRGRVAGVANFLLISGPGDDSITTKFRAKTVADGQFIFVIVI